MTILVTGGAGYIGSVVVERLINMGQKVVVLDNLSTGHRQAVHPKAEFVHGDIRDAVCLDHVFGQLGIDGVIHMAAKALIPESITDPAPFYDINLLGSIRLADAMVAHGVKRIIMSSTAAVYGQPESVPIDENAPTHPMNSYGETKLSFERMLCWYSRAYGVEATIFRYFSAAGASASYGEAHVPETHLIPRLLLAALTETPTAEIYGTDYDTPDGACLRDFVHVVDLADAHIRALEVPNSSGFRVYNMGSGVGYSVLSVVDNVEKITGTKFERRFLPRRKGDPARLVASSAKAVRELGWNPAHPTLDGILMTAWNWHRSHPDGFKA
jgi:UDP-glucose 4-epimerase